MRPGAAARRTACSGLRLLLLLLAAQRPCWRRETLLETWVAVPAITAVRATPRISPGMSVPFSGYWDVGVVGFESREQRLDGDATAGDQLTATAPYRAAKGPAQTFS